MIRSYLAVIVTIMEVKQSKIDPQNLEMIEIYRENLKPNPPGFPFLDNPYL